jgi:hypothetical protein
MTSFNPKRARRALQRPPARLLGLMALSCLLLAMMPLPSLAHPTGDSHLRLLRQPGQKLAVQWDLSLRDLDDELLLDADEDGRLSAHELAPRWHEVLAWAQTQLGVHTAAGPCTASPTTTPARGLSPELWRHADGLHARLRWQLKCPPLDTLTVHYAALSATPDNPHRALVYLQGQGPTQRVMMGGPRTRHTFRPMNGT